MTRNVYIHPLLDLDSAVRSLLSVVDDPVLALSRSGEVLLYNAGMQRLTGYPWQEFAGRSWFAVVYPDPEEQAAAAEELQAVFDADADIAESRWAITRKDGVRRTVLFRPVPLRDSVGEIVAVFSALPDLTESDAPIARRLGSATVQVDLEKELAVLVFRIDARSGRLLFVSPSAKPLLGYAPDDFYRDPRLFTSRVKPAYDEPLAAAIRSAARGAARAVEMAFIHREDREVTLSVMLQPVKDKRGEVITIEGVARDVTSRKNAEWRVEKSLRELTAAYEQLHAQHEELLSLDRFKSQILANVSHELRTPLVTIMGYNELMRKGSLGPLTDGQQRGLMIASRSIARLMLLIENLLDFARLEHHRFRLPDAQVNLGEILDGLVEDLRPELARKRLSLEYTPFDASATVRGDRKRLAQVFRNLMDNAIKFSPENETVALRCLRCAEQEVAVEVSDRGMGIPEEEHERIFDSFYQIDGSSTRTFPGVGIGLAVSRELVELHGGAIHVRSQSGRGACFAVHLPVADPGSGAV